MTSLNKNFLRLCAKQAFMQEQQTPANADYRD